MQSLGSRRWGPTAATATSLACFAFAAQAEPSAALPLHLTYAAPPECIDARAFESRLRALPERGEGLGGPATVDVRIVRESAGLTATVQVRSEDGALVTRTLQGTSCDELTDGLTFITALALGLAPPAAAAAFAPVLDAPPQSPSDAPSHATAEVPTVLRVPTARADIRDAPTQPPPRFPVHVAVGIQGTLVSMIGPTVRPAPAAFVAIASNTPALFSPEVRLGGFGARSEGIDGFSGVTHVDLIAGQLEACPLQMALTQAVGIRPCLGVQIGEMRGQAAGSSLTDTHLERRVWVSGVAEARLSVHLWRALFVEVEGGLNVPFLRHRFYFGPDTTVYKVPGLGEMASAGIRADLP